MRRAGSKTSLVGFRVIGTITGVEEIASGRGIRDLKRLQRVYGPGKWKKKKGRCLVQYDNGVVRPEEVHWYEAHGIGRKEMKVK